MSTHRFGFDGRTSTYDGIQTITVNHPVREFLRSNGPNGRQGFVVEDIDASVVIRHYGTDGGSRGKVLLTEWKHGHQPRRLETAQTMTFGLMHKLMRAARSEAYAGFWIITHTERDPHHIDCVFYVQRMDELEIDGPLTAGQLVKMLADPFPPYKRMIR